MTKSILVINTPDHCFDCPVHQFLEGDKDDGYSDVMFCNAENWRKPTTHTPILDFTKRPDWCPLRPLPKKLKLRIQREWLGDYDRYEIGYNACRDDIIGETK